MNNLKNIISENRKKLNMTQRELANKINVSDKQISKWETGMSYPDITILNSLANALNISVNKLLESDDLKSSDKENEVDYNFLKEIKQSLVVSSLSILFCFILAIIANLIGLYYELAGIIVLLITLVLLFGSLIYLFITNNNEKNKISTKINDDIYKQKYYFKNSIVVLFFVIPVLIIFYIVEYSYVIFMNLNLNQIVSNILLIIALILLEIPSFLKYNLQIESRFKAVNKVLKYSVIVVIVLLVLNTVLLNIYSKDLFEFGYLYKYIVVLIKLTKVLILVHVVSKITNVFLINKIE